MPFDDYYVWSYHIKIKNDNKERVQLVNRHWIIIDDLGQAQEVAGAGVIGMQPLIGTGKEFEYASSVHLNRSSGVMMGKYEMTTEDEELLEVEIPTFSLDCPHVKVTVN